MNLVQNIVYESFRKLLFKFLLIFLNKKYSVQKPPYSAWQTVIFRQIREHSPLGGFSVIQRLQHRFFHKSFPFIYVQPSRKSPVNIGHPLKKFSHRAVLHPVRLTNTAALFQGSGICNRFFVGLPQTLEAFRIILRIHSCQKPSVCLPNQALVLGFTYPQNRKNLLNVHVISPFPVYSEFP